MDGVFVGYLQITASNSHHPRILHSRAVKSIAPRSGIKLPPLNSVSARPLCRDVGQQRAFLSAILVSDALRWLTACVNKDAVLVTQAVSVTNS